MSERSLPDELAELEALLAGLSDRPVEDHPEALEVVHRTVVSELDGLSGVGAPAAADDADGT